MGVGQDPSASPPGRVRERERMDQGRSEREDAPREEGEGNQKEGTPTQDERNQKEEESGNGKGWKGWNAKPSVSPHDRMTAATEAIET